MKEEKLGEVRKQILLSFKFIADLAFARLIRMTAVTEILSELLKENEDHINFLNFGKITLLFCGLGHLIFEQENEELRQMLEHFLKETPSHIQFYSKREKLASETTIEDLKDLSRR